MNAVGIDASKGKSTVAIMQPFGEVVAEPFEGPHTDAELRKLACFLEKLPGETWIVMEYTGSYWQPIAKVLHNAGLLVSGVNALLDGMFLSLNTLFKSASKDTDGHEKWVDFAGRFWHRQCVCGNYEKAFANQYRKWCDKAGYRFSEEKTACIYAYVASQVNTLPMTDAIKCLVTLAATQLNTIIETISVIQHEMLTLASQLPEYPVVMRMFGVDPVLDPQLMAEIGDIRRFHRKQSLMAFVGVDAPSCQSGTFESKNRHISKRGSPRLRKTLFQIMSTIIQHSPADDLVFQFLDRKRQEGKHYYVYMTAAANKFLRIYYGIVIAYLEKL